jgi:putative ATP-grasp target RiPP
MSEYPIPLWRDPLFSPGDRFPLGPPRGIMGNCHEGPSGPSTRPFSLRHVVAGARLDEVPLLRYRYCPLRQIALVSDEDGSLVPLLRHTKPGATPGATSGYVGTPDGQGGSPEEVGDPDHQED